jgi:hypothetical protein
VHASSGANDERPCKASGRSPGPAIPLGMQREPRRNSRDVAAAKSCAEAKPKPNAEKCASDTDAAATHIIMIRVANSDEGESPRSTTADVITRFAG